MVHAGLNVYGCRGWLSVTYGRYLMDGQHVTPRRQPGAVAMTLCDVGNRSAIDPKIVPKIPSEVWYSVYHQATRRCVIGPKITRRRTPLRNDAGENCANKNKNRKNDASEAVPCFHGIQCSYELDFGEQIVRE
jgi:hypothetical protein